MANKTYKLQKIIAETGYASRRAAEQLIIDGRVKIGNKIAELGMRVLPNVKISIDDKLINKITEEKLRLIMYNKPPGQVCTRDDPEGRPTVFEHLPELHAGRWIMIGRLDYHTQGLLLFTNNGALANEMMHPSNEYEREYRVRVIGVMHDEQLKLLRSGVTLDDGVARFDRIVATGSAGGKNQWFKVVLKEGRNRIVRRLFESQNLTISRLMRVRFGDYALPRELKTGEVKEIKVKASPAVIPRKEPRG